MTFQIINPPPLGTPSGWNNGMLAPSGGRLLFIAGQTARDASGRVTTSGLVEQLKQALENVLNVVRESGGKAEDIGRMTLYVTDLETYRGNLKPLGEAYRSLMGNHYPAMALVEVSGLADERAIIEIEATAVLPLNDGGTAVGQ